MMYRIGLCVAVFAFALVSSLPARANLVLGTIGFKVDGTITPASGSLNQAFTVTDVLTSNAANGDWTNFANNMLVSSSMSFGAFGAANTSFSFTDPNFGTFSGNVVLDTGSVGDASFSQRQLVISGTFNPGATLVAQGYTGQVFGQLNVIILAAGTGGRSASMVFGTTSVPEPTSMALVGLSSILMVGMRCRRRRMTSSHPLPH